MSIYIITREENEYDQYGEYFVAVYLNKPTLQQLKAILPEESDATIGRLTRGGGRHNYEHTWYNLHEVQEGTAF